MPGKLLSCWIVLNETMARTDYTGLHKREDSGLLRGMPIWPENEKLAISEKKRSDLKFLFQ